MADTLLQRTEIRKGEAVSCGAIRRSPPKIESEPRRIKPALSGEVIHPSVEKAKGLAPAVGEPKASDLLEEMVAAPPAEPAGGADSDREKQKLGEIIPCFFHRDCRGTAELQKQGKSVCRKCGAGLKGDEYPLRKPSREPLYPNVRELVLQLEMKESGHGRSET